MLKICQIQHNQQQICDWRSNQQWIKIVGLVETYLLKIVLNLKQKSLTMSSGQDSDIWVAYVKAEISLWSKPGPSSALLV